MERGIGPPGGIGLNGTKLANSAISLVTTVILYFVHVALELSLIIIATTIILHPALLRMPDFIMMVAVMCIVDIWISKKLASSQ